MTLSVALQILLGLAVAYYSLVMLALHFGIRRLDFQRTFSRPFVSVVVAARNEEKNLPRLLDHLASQKYDRYEVIVVDDRSTDNSSHILGQYEKQFPTIRSLKVESTAKGMPAKKYALSVGIESSKGEILCLTDADCAPPPDWIGTLVSAFDEETGLVAGYSPYAAQPHRNDVPHRMLHRFIEYEEYKAAIWSAGAIGVQKGWLCTGRSMAYRRCVYEQVGGFEQIKQFVSGDDDLFLQLVRRQTSWKIRYVIDEASFVPTVPPASFGEFVRQRIRHFSAGKLFPFPMKMFFFSFHLANLLILSGLIFSFFTGLPYFLLLPYVCKCVIDSFVFFNTASLFNQQRFVWTFLFMEVIYVLYNSFVGPLGFIMRFEWKPEKNQ